MSGQNANLALMVARGVGAEIAFNSSGGAADWIMLMPIAAGGIVNTVDGRGPYRCADPAKLAAASLAAHQGRIPIDENHATDLAAPQGRPAPARGWASQLEARSDGIYGHVEWSVPGAELMAQKAYRFISPVIMHDKAGNVLDLPRASLTNTPNLLGMAALHAQENEMDLLAQLIKLLGLPDGSDAAAVIAAVKKEVGDADTAMQSIAKAVGVKADADAPAIVTAIGALKSSTALQSVAKAAGLKDDADLTSIVTAVTSLKAGAAAGESATIASLQSEIKDLGNQLTTALASTAKDKAEAYVDGQIKLGRVGVKPLRDHYVTMHAADPARVEKEISAMPIIGATGALETPPENKDGKIALNADQLNAAKLLGVKPEDYQKTLQSERAA